MTNGLARWAGMIQAKVQGSDLRPIRAYPREKLMTVVKDYGAG